MTPEGKIKKEIADYLSTFPSWKMLFHYHVAPKTRMYSSKHMRSGVPDIEGIFKGLAFYMEVKAPGNTLRPDQRAFFMHCDLVGGFAFEVKSVDDAKKAIESMENLFENSTQTLKDLLLSRRGPVTKNPNLDPS